MLHYYSFLPDYILNYVLNYVLNYIIDSEKIYQKEG